MVNFSLRSCDFSGWRDNCILLRTLGWETTLNRRPLVSQSQAFVLGKRQFVKLNPLGCKSSNHELVCYLLSEKSENPACFFSTWLLWLLFPGQNSLSLVRKWGVRGMGRKMFRMGGGYNARLWNWKKFKHRIASHSENQNSDCCHSLFTPF